MKFGEVYDFRTAEEAKKYIGKEGVFIHNLRKIIESPAEIGYRYTLSEVDEMSDFPFLNQNETRFQFFRPVLEDDELMTNRQLAEWVARGNGEYAFGQASTAFCSYDYSRANEHDSVSVTTLIRRWNDTEWVKPTKAIYEEDCKPNTAINKEDCQ